jgi:hypothetical protein
MSVRDTRSATVGRPERVPRIERERSRPRAARRRMVHREGGRQRARTRPLRAATSVRHLDLAVVPASTQAPGELLITETLQASAISIKKLADYCGTSVEMIERHYADWMAPESAAELAALGGTPAATATMRRAV